MDQMARLKHHMGDLGGAIEIAQDSFRKFQHPETEGLLRQLLDVKAKLEMFEKGDKEKTTDVVFTCIPNSHPYAFDEEVYNCLRAQSAALSTSA